MGVEFQDNRAAARAAMERAKLSALTAIGMAAVEITANAMRQNYDEPIQQDLIDDLDFQVNETAGTVDIGNRLGSSSQVHNGAPDVQEDASGDVQEAAARPYLRDALSKNADIWKEIAKEHIDKEMNFDD